MTRTQHEFSPEEEAPRKKGKQVAQRVAAPPQSIAPYTAQLQQAAAAGQWQTVEKMMDLQARWEAQQAKREFDEAIARAKSEIKPIKKNKRVAFDAKQPGGKRTDFMHETLDEVARSIDGILSENGLNYRFRTHSPPNEPVTVTCIIAHRGGHSEENSLSAGRDDTGGKNSLQAIASTVTYLQRYTLKAALGLSAAQDDDGNLGVTDKISDSQYEALQQTIVEVGQDIPRFLKLYGIDKVSDLPARAFEGAMEALEKKRGRPSAPEHA